MKKYFKFAIITAVFLTLSYWAAFNTDMFGTAFASLPAMIFFIVNIIIALISIIKKKQIKHNLMVTGCSIFLIFSLGIPIKISNRGLHELTQKRMQILKELRPVFLKYKTENGAYPVSLDDLVPKYIQEMPRELINNGKDDPYKKISYTLTEGGPVFAFRTIRGPDSAAVYNVDKDTLWHDQ